MSEGERLAETRAALAARRAAARTGEPRGAEPRDEYEPIGTMAHPGPAERRSEPTREHYRPEVREEEVFTRRKRHERTMGHLEVPAHRKKPGWDYQFITITVLNQPVDSARIRDFRENGAWRPVLAKDIPEMADYDASGDSPIETEGQRLMTRPMSLTLEAREEDRAEAEQQQYDRTRAAASGVSALRNNRFDQSISGLPDHRGVRRVPVEIAIEGLAGS